MIKNNHKIRSRSLNYGFVRKHHRGYRNALRQCRKNKKRYGAAFDYTESNDLQMAMCVFMEKHNFPVNKVYLRFYGKAKNGEDIQLLYPKLKELLNGEPVFEVFEEIETDFSKLILGLDESYKLKLIDFLFPRVECFADMYLSENLPTEDDFGKTLQLVINSLKEKNIDKLLIDRKKLFF